MELVHGVIRRQSTLDALLQPHVTRPIEKVEAGALTLLRMGAYQLFLLSGVPAYAVVNEAAELARRIGKPQWTGFINGVLRSASRAVSDEYPDAPAVDALPLADGRYRIVRGLRFPDPAIDFAGYFAAAFGFPHWLVERWRRRYSPGDLTRLGFWFDAPPRLSLRANSGRTTRAAFLEALSAAGIAAQPCDHPDGVRLDGSARVPELPGFRDGWFAVQDESAMWAASLLAPAPGERILDLCAAPGGKSTHLAALMHDTGSIIAADVDPERLALVDENCRRLGLSIVGTRVVRHDSSDLPEGPFDGVLMDVPCSNTGVLGKRPEARWRLTPGDITELTDLQRRLWRAAASRVRPGGRIVYSTCSIEPEENQQLVRALLDETGQNGGTEWALLEERSHAPGQPADGGYQALLRRVK